MQLIKKLSSKSHTRKKKSTLKSLKTLRKNTTLKISYHKSHLPLSTSTTWDEGQYSKFRDERKQPFFDLISMIHKSGTQPFKNVVDLGCGGGELTNLLQDFLKSKNTLGIDNSKEMLKDSKKWENQFVKFETIDIDSFLAKNANSNQFDLVFSNAALHWINGHEKLFKMIDKVVHPHHGQIAIQVPVNHTHLAWTIIPEVLEHPKFSKYAKNFFKTAVENPEVYSYYLHRLGYKSQKVTINVYPHLLKSAAEIAEWTKGSALSYYRAFMPKDVFDQFFEEYKRVLLSRISNPDESPYLFPFKRLFIWGSKEEL